MKRNDRPIATLWFEHLKTKEEQEDFKKLLRNSTITLGRLFDIIQKKRLEVQRAETKVDVYDSPNWAYKQADTNGCVRALRNLEDLLRFASKE